MLATGEPRCLKTETNRQTLLEIHAQKRDIDAEQHEPTYNCC